MLESWRKETADSYPAPIKPTPSCSYSGAGTVNLVTCGLDMYSQTSYKSPPRLQNPQQIIVTTIWVLLCQCLSENVD